MVRDIVDLEGLGYYYFHLDGYRLHIMESKTPAMSVYRMMCNNTETGFLYKKLFRVAIF